ncbi:uncharacterized protein [Solanum lycopersicum]|uniref:uncharacterized protein n=1 Tax=Solanum lycopersicum TaxID=4081 RepID=UPI003748BEBB
MRTTYKKNTRHNNYLQSAESYADSRKLPLEFDVSDQEDVVESEVHWAIQYSTLCGEVAYELALPAELAFVNPVFHVSLLKKCLGDPAMILHVEGLGVDEDLYYEEVPGEILDLQVKRLRNKEVPIVKVLWRNHLVEDASGRPRPI